MSAKPTCQWKYYLEYTFQPDAKTAEPCFEIATSRIRYQNSDGSPRETIHLCSDHRACRFGSMSTEEDLRKEKVPFLEWLVTGEDIPEETKVTETPDERFRRFAEAIAETVMLPPNSPPIDWKRVRKEAEEKRLEKLAALQHEAWCFWTHALVSAGRIPDWLVAKWKPSWVPYVELPEGQKEKDRMWARRIVEILEER